MAVDLSSASLAAGLVRNVPETRRGDVSVHRADVRAAAAFLPAGGVRFAFLGGNSLGDVTDVAGHTAFLRSLASALSPGGVLVFDYVGERYAPAGEHAATEWPEVFQGDAGAIPVIDRRTRRVSPVPGTPMSILRFTAEVVDARTGETVVASHAYDKLIVPDALLTRQFADAGLRLTNAGRVADLSPYHRDRIRRRSDLGMLGEPDCFYRAVRI